jgi:prolyl-tRNA synthetase
MKESELFLKTSKEKPVSADNISAELLIRAGFIDKLSAGIYSYLPLGLRVLRKVENIIREEMNGIGGEEILMPVIQPKALWEETGRWDKMDPPLFKLKDRHDREYGLGSTHEEVICDLVRERVDSYRDLPFMLYQIQDKFRNEMRSTGGLLRVREFIMKDAYSFHADLEDLENYYPKVVKAYFNIFERLGLEAIQVEASSGTIGGKVNHEFMVLSKTGEDNIVVCECGFGSNEEVIMGEKKCPKCESIIKKDKAIEVGHTFQLGDKYSKAMKVVYRDQEGKEKFVQMGCYGIGLGRAIAAVIETHHDEQGMIWPESISPFDIHLINLVKDKKEADKIHEELSKKYDVLYDDRDISAGEKLAEADLIGITKRVVVSEKTLKENKIELKLRKDKEAKLVSLSELN